MSVTYHNYHGDCLVESATFSDRSIDLVLTDLPSEATTCEWDTRIPFAPMWDMLYRIAKPNAAVVLFATQPPFSDDLRSSNRDHYRYTLYWSKNMVSGFQFSAYQPLRAMEEICVFYREQPTYNPQLRRSRISDRTFRDGAPNGGSERRKNEHNLGVKAQTSTFAENVLPTNVLEGFPCVARATGTRHPTEKPVALCEYLIKTYSSAGDTVLDFTAGSFSTGEACLNTNRNFIGIERDPDFFREGEARMKARAEAIDRMLLKPWQLQSERKSQPAEQLTTDLLLRQ